jgi:hypothetical protein
MVMSRISTTGWPAAIGGLFGIPGSSGAIGRAGARRGNENGTPGSCNTDPDVPIVG